MTEFLPIVSPQWLQSQLSKPEVVIVDCRFSLKNPQFGYQAYLEGHIPSAHYLHLEQDLSSEVKIHGGRHPLPANECLANKLVELGIEQGKTLVVAYDDSRFAFASRLWWLLRYLGHEQVALLDGGWNSWQNLGYQISTKQPASNQTGNFTAKPQLTWVVDRETLKLRKDLPGVVLIDSRSPERYRGEREPIDPIAGHIPGAVNSPWQVITDVNGNLRSLAVQRQIWSKYAEAEEIILYCGSGVTACVNLFSLNLVGHHQTKLYIGGWSDWCSYLI